MIEYIKVWTSFLDDEWTITLSATARGVFLQMLILCRKSSEKSSFIQRSARSLAEICGCDAGTMRKYLRDFSTSGKISVQELSSGAIRVEVLNYNYWQELRGNKNVKEKVETRRKTREKPTEISASNPIQSNPIQEYIHTSFNSICKDLPPIKSITVQRETAIKNRLVDLKTTDDWQSFFKSIHASDYLSGRVNGWRATFDWILKPMNFTKIREGNYINRATTKSLGGVGGVDPGGQYDGL